MKLASTTKVYVAGCGGMLGDAVFKEFSSTSEVFASDLVNEEEWISLADVRDYNEIKDSVLKFSPNVIINLAAITDMEKCELDPKNAWETNALGAENLALIANQLDVPYVYISTAGIFGGEEEEFDDFADPTPLSIYAKSKYWGERYIRENVSKHFVVRAGWMMGGGPKKDKKFVNKIFSQILEGEKVLKVVDDKFGTPTYTHDFAKGLRLLIESDLFGVYNQCCEGSCSRFDVAKEFVECLGLSDSIELEKVDSAHFSKEYFASRPRSEKLSSFKLKARGLYVMRDWEVALQEYSEQFIDQLENRR
jgi:dTDP-4-dehydrorhamnose reductase